MEGSEKLVIIPKIKPLTAPELVALRGIEYSSLKSGLKKTVPDGSQEEAEELTKMLAELKKELSVPRVERLSCRAEGVWDPERLAVKVLRRQGKFNVFGYFLGSDLYLEDYEALFLLELNRMDIIYHSMSMSIEQAYALFLGEEKSQSYNQYLVYSMFSRAGYIVQKYQNLAFSSKTASVEDCIWEILLNSVQNKPISEHIRKSEHFVEVDRSMNAIRSQIIGQEDVKQGANVEPEEQRFSFGSNFQTATKRKASSEGSVAFKRARYDHDHPPPHNSFIDFLTEEEEYKKFADIFQNFDIVRLKPQFDYDDEAESELLEIQFDIHMHNDNFKKSVPKPPAFRLALLNSNQKFPNRSVISKCYHSQEYRVPVLVVMISESKHIQAFLYHFT